jgi:HEAT repeats
MRMMLACLCALPLLAAARPALAQKANDAKPTPPPVEQLGGKTINEWIKELKTAKDPSKVENDIRTILLFGPDAAQAAMPHLLSILRKHSRTTPVDTSVRVNTVIAVGEIIGNSKERPGTNQISEAVTLLTRLLRDDERIVRYRSAVALAQIGPEAKSAISELILASRDTSTWETRHAAVLALGSVAVDRKNGPPIKVLEALYNGLRDSATQVRMAAVQSLVRLGPPADKAQRAALERELEPVAKSDPDPTVRIWTHIAIMNFKGQPEDWRLDTIGKMLSSPELTVRTQAAQALADVGKHAKKQVHRLQAALSDPDPFVVGWCIVALARMGRDAGPAIERLRQIAADPQQPEPVKRSAQQALDMIEGRAMNKEDKGANK